MRSLWVTAEMRERADDKYWESHVPGGTWRQLQRHEIPPSTEGKCHLCGHPETMHIQATS